MTSHPAVTSYPAVTSHLQLQAPRSSATASRPLLVTADPTLLDDVARIAAAVGLEMDVRSTVALAGALWSAATAVLLGDDVTSGVTSGMDRTAVSRRSEVIILGTDPEDAEVWERAVKIGARHVVFLPDAEEWLAEMFADLLEGRPEPAPLVAVVGGRGGAGATTLAAGLAVTASRLGRRVVLVDADPLGGGIDLVLGSEAVSGLRWPDLVGTRGRVSSSALLDALPTTDNLAVLSCDRGGALSISAPAMEALVPAAQRGADLVVVDLPRRLDDAASSAASRAATVLLVVPAEIRAAAAAVRVAAAVSSYCEDVRVVVRGPSPGRLDAAAVADSLGLPLAGFLRPEPGLAAALERGDVPAVRGRGPLAAFCAEFLSSVTLPSRQVAA